MQLLLGLLVVFSILLTADRCSGSMKECPFKNAACMTLKTEMTILVKIVSIVKSCSPEDKCKQLQEQKGNILSGPLPNMSDIIPSFQFGAVIKEVTCNRAPLSLASFLPAVLGLLPMKLLLF